MYRFDGSVVNVEDEDADADDVDEDDADADADADVAAVPGTETEGFIHANVWGLTLFSSSYMANNPWLDHRFESFRNEAQASRA